MATKKRNKKGRPAREWSAYAPKLMLKFHPYTDDQKVKLGLIHWAQLKTLEMGIDVDEAWQACKARLTIGRVLVKKFEDAQTYEQEICTADRLLECAYRHAQKSGEVIQANLISVRNAFDIIDELETHFDRYEIYKAHFEAMKVAQLEDALKQP